MKPLALAASCAILAAAALSGLPPLGCSRPAPSSEAGNEPARPVLLTTDGTLAANNLLAELAQAERQHGERPGDQRRSRALVERLLAHAQFFGRLADYDEAEAVAKSAVGVGPQSGDAHLLLARVDSSLHQFPKALAELDMAAALAADRDTVFKARVGIWQATGQVDRALGYLQSWRRERPDLTTYGAEASAYADKRQFASAGVAFAEAARHFGDVSPFAVAWLEFQEGHMWESAGRADKARPLFESALRRLPIYAAAAGHLAALDAAFGDPSGLERAEGSLTALVARTDDPEYVGQLAAVTRQQGRKDEADRLEQRAATMFDALLRCHPEAFFDHAARFYLHVAGDPRRALGLAQKNFALRPTADARDLRDEAQRALDAEALFR